MEPNGLLSMHDPPMLGPPLFKVGLQSAAIGRIVLQTVALYNEASKYLFVRANGIEKLYKAGSDATLTI